MSTLVRVLAVSHVHPDEAAVGAAWPPPNTVELSFLDSFQVARGAIQRLFFYEGDDLPPFQSIVGALQSSLAAALPVFLPLSGKLAYLPESGDVVIDYSPDAVSPGVRFVEAEYSGSVDDMRRLAGDDEHQIEAFLQLVPELEVSMLPAPLLAVQVTRPRDDNVGGGGAGGAVAVGVAIHHGVADGQSVWQFIKAYLFRSVIKLKICSGLRKKNIKVSAPHGIRSFPIVGCPVIFNDRKQFGTVRYRYLEILLARLNNSLQIKCLEIWTTYPK
uniref:Anthocyanin 5-aromatic acyltransferase-like n=1 Tax=Oryza sativa subsp. japonica TaxID=39947 RepID=Q5VP58_ORYSJ|nr:anthocyanin 5-aromatic acyltransferase-like [Oryza sativa Japonica Group]BAD68767.1 anthocyanin 5-aromatic acyltransferase-like [Oryza sativa Japonica Group]